MAKRYYTVWSVEFENDNRAKVSLSRSRKVRDNSYDNSLVKAGIAKNGYVTDFSDSYVNFVGKSVNQLKKHNIQKGDRIYADIEISNEPFVGKDGNVGYPKGYKHTVYEFDLPDEVNNNRNYDKAPVVANDEDINDDEPF